MVAYGVVHGCLGKCCSIDYPSVFNSLGDDDVLKFLNSVGIAVGITPVPKDQNNIPIIIGITILVIIMMIFGFLYIRRSCHWPLAISR